VVGGVARQRRQQHLDAVPQVRLDGVAADDRAIRIRLGVTAKITLHVE